MLCGLDADAWAMQMKDAIWNRDADTRDKLLAKARKNRIKELPAELDNLEPKATLRAIIHEGDWEHFKRCELASEQSCFAQALQTRLQQAVTKGRLGPGVVADIERPRPAAALADRNLPQAHAG